MNQIISILMFFFMLSCSHIDRTKIAREVQLQKNTVKIQMNESFGTASYISYNNKSYLITNAHVCLGDKYQHNMDRKTVEGIFDTDYLFYRIKGVEYFVNVDKIKLNLEYDICLFPSKRGLTYTLAEPRLGEYVFYFTRIRGKLYKKFGRVISSEIKTIPIVFKDKVKIQNSAFYVSTPTVGGESGTPVFNYYQELVGLVFARASTRSKKKLGLIVSSKYIKKMIEGI